ncbi:hypothetical protein J4462_00915 [Candidatus Pacearchaeota archaeon]|nr:hypothetical protein [Candidatus Pacearchaeota archaeon]
MSKRKLFIVLILLLSLTSVSAITASIGNSRMVLRLSIGEEVEKYVLVKNINDVPITIDISVSGDLADSVELIDEQFVLNPKEEKKAYFRISTDEKRTTETKINVKFTPEEGQGVGLSSTVVLIANDDMTNDEEQFDELSDEINEEDTQDEENDDAGEFNFNPRNVPDEEEKGLSITQLLILSSAILVLVFVILIVYANKVNRRKKKVGRSNV